MPQYPRKNRGPQLVLEGEFKQTERSDLVVFEIPWGPITLACIVTVPEEGKTRAPVYVKVRVGQGQPGRKRPHTGNNHRGPSLPDDPTDIRYEVGNATSEA